MHVLWCFVNQRPVDLHWFCVNDNWDKAAAHVQVGKWVVMDSSATHLTVRWVELILVRSEFPVTFQWTVRIVASVCKTC